MVGLQMTITSLWSVRWIAIPCLELAFVISFIWLQRKSEGEHESSRRLKTQFLIEMEGFDSGSEQILLIGDC